MKQFPENVVLYKTTPEINEETVPAGWMRPHKTKGAVWGKIVILEGTLQYLVNEPEGEVVTLDENICGVIEPNILHAVKPLGKVRFYVEFYRTESGTGTHRASTGGKRSVTPPGKERSTYMARRILTVAMVILILAVAVFLYWTGN